MSLKVIFWNRKSNIMHGPLSNCYIASVTSTLWNHTWQKFSKEKENLRGRNFQKKKIKKKKKQLMWFGYTESHWKLQGRLRRENCIVYSRVKRRRGRLKKNLGRLKENVTRDLMVNNNKLHLCSYWYCCSWRTACKLFYYQHSIIIESPNLQTVY